MKSRLAFVARFLALFALLILAGWLTDAPRRFAAALRLAATITSPIANGWSFEQRDESAGRQELWFRRGNEQLRFQISLAALALSLLPLLSLLGATPGLGVAGFAARAAIGIAALFVLDLLVVLIYPWLVGSPNALTDIVGTFIGLLTFVGGPVILWFVLTYRQLGSIWRLDFGRPASHR
jgi:hypothetical protein